jgi:hypothetical protein
VDKTVKNPNDDARAEPSKSNETWKEYECRKGRKQALIVLFLTLDE